MERFKKREKKQKLEKNKRYSKNSRHGKEALKYNNQRAFFSREIFRMML